MSDFQEYPDVVQEVRGAYNPGRLKLQSSSVIFKNAKTGKVDQYQSSDIERVNWLKRARGNCLKFILNTGLVHRYDGFKETEFEKLATFMSKYYALSLEKQDMSVKGWNWGCAKFIGNSLDFEVDNKLAFEIPLNNVSHSTTTKNEVTLEFHQNDDAAVSLMEIRFHIPSTTENSEKDPVQDFYNMVVDKADIIQATGDAIATFTELQCLTPRGRYDFKIFQSFLQLHGKTFDYKIPYTTVLRLFLLPHKDGRQMFFVISLDPPIKQGQTRYPFIILLFNKDDEMTLNLTMSEEDLEKKYEGKLQPEISGPDYEVISRVFKAITNRKITVPGSFVGHSGTNAISCSYKAATGFLYPLERGFVFIHKPPLHIRFDEVAFVNFGRSAGSTKSFDFDVETKSGTVYNFVGIEKDEYGKLYDFVTQKNLRVKNIGGKLGGKSSYAEDMVGSDDDDEHDAYMERMKEEGKDRFEGDEEDDSDSSDVSYNPGGSSSEVAEEYDSNPPTTDEEDSSEGGSGEDEAKKEERRKRKEEKKKAKAAKTVKEPGERKSKKSKKKSKDSNKPKRPQSAYFLWFNANREDIKKELPGASVTDISKRAGELWKEVTDRSEWDAKAEEAKKEYQKAMEEYNKTKAEKGDSDSEDDSKKSSKKKDKKKSPKKSKSSETTAGSGGQYKSKEFISSSSSDSDKPLKKKTRTERAKKKNDGAESDKSSSVGELPSEEEILPSPEKSSAGSGSESESGSD